MNASKSVVGIDIAKRVFQLYWIDMETGEVSSLQLKRERFLEHFANRQACLIAAFAGLVPRQTGTGGRIKLLGISKRGDTYLRTLLIHGARAVLTSAKEPGQWVSELRQRRPINVAVVALANKMARTIWALVAHERTYQKCPVSQPA